MSDFAGLRDFRIGEHLTIQFPGGSDKKLFSVLVNNTSHTIYAGENAGFEFNSASPDYDYLFPAEWKEGQVISASFKLKILSTDITYTENVKITLTNKWPKILSAYYEQTDPEILAITNDFTIVFDKISNVSYHITDAVPGIAPIARYILSYGKGEVYSKTNTINLEGGDKFYGEGNLDVDYTKPFLLYAEDSYGNRSKTAYTITHIVFPYVRPSFWCEGRKSRVNPYIIDYYADISFSKTLVDAYPVIPDSFSIDIRFRSLDKELPIITKSVNVTKKSETLERVFYSVTGSMSDEPTDSSEVTFDMQCFTFTNGFNNTSELWSNRSIIIGVSPILSLRAEKEHKTVAIGQASHPNMHDSLQLKHPLRIQYGGTGASTPIEAAQNLMTGYSASGDGYIEFGGFLIQWGSVKFDSFITMTPKSVSTFFPKDYGDKSPMPKISLCPITSAPETVSVSIKPGATDNTGFSIVATRTEGTAGVGVHWIAIGPTVP